MITVHTKGFTCNLQGAFQAHSSNLRYFLILKSTFVILRMPLKTCDYLMNIKQSQGLTLSPKLSPMCFKGSLQASQTKGQSQPQTPSGQREMREERGKWRKKSHNWTKTRGFAHIIPNTYGEGTWWDLQRKTQNGHKWGNTILGLRDSRTFGELMVTDKKPDKRRPTKCCAQWTKPGLESVLLEKPLAKFLHGCGCSIPAAPQIPPGVTTQQTVF